MQTFRLNRAVLKGKSVFFEREVCVLESLDARVQPQRAVKRTILIDFEMGQKPISNRRSSLKESIPPVERAS